MLSLCIQYGYNIWYNIWIHVYDMIKNMWPYLIQKWSYKLPLTRSMVLFIVCAFVPFIAVLQIFPILIHNRVLGSVQNNGSPAVSIHFHCNSGFVTTCVQIDSISKKLCLGNLHELDFQCISLMTMFSNDVLCWNTLRKWWLLPFDCKEMSLSHIFAILRLLIMHSIAVIKSSPSFNCHVSRYSMVFFLT
jgi:hypothetical protein